jgi:hypothetical protein
MPDKKNEFANVELPDPQKKGVKVTRKGKKSVTWNEDPEILKRLTRVAELMLSGKYAWEIAEENRCSLATAKRDIRRVRDLWAAEAMDKLDSLLGDSLATYQRIMKTAWANIVRYPEKSAQYLREIRETQKEIDKLGGLVKPETLNVEVSGEIATRDITQVREERWNQVKDMLPDVIGGQK